MGTSRTSIEDRLRAVEDTLAIYQLIASHPPAADTGTDRYYRDAFTPDGSGSNCGHECHTIVAGKDYVFTAYGKR